MNGVIAAVTDRRALATKTSNKYMYTVYSFVDLSSSLELGTILQLYLTAACNLRAPVIHVVFARHMYTACTYIFDILLPVQQLIGTKK